MSHWYALRVVSRQEAFVAKALKEADLTGYVPQHITEAKFARRKATRSRPLLSGYVLADLPDDEAIAAAMEIQGVVRGAHRIPLRALDIGALVLFEACHVFDETWKPPKAKGKRYSHRWKRGDRVRVLGGPFEGHVGTVKRAHNKTRMEVEFVLFGRAQEVVVEHRALEMAA